MSALGTTLAINLLKKASEGLLEAAKDKLSIEAKKWGNAQRLKHLTEKIAVTAQVKTFWQRDKSVDLREFYYPTRLSYQTRQEPTSDKTTHIDAGKQGPLSFTPKSVEAVRVETLADLIRDDHVVLEGVVGQGKSTFLRFLCVQELTDKGSGRIPVFIELRSVNEDGLYPLLYSAIERLGFEINEELFEIYAKTGKFVLLLDAFDEIPEAYVKKVLLELEHISEVFGSTQLIVTARPESHIQNCRQFRVVRLCQLTQEDHEPFLRRIGFEPERAASFVTALKNSNSKVSKLLTTPLMMTLLATLYEVELVIPSDVPRFYERLFSTLLSKHDSTKPGFRRIRESGLDEDSLHTLFCAFCFFVLKLDLPVRLSLRQFNSAFENACKWADINCASLHFRADITRITSLMVEEGIEYEFVHQSVLEYYSASFVTMLSDDEAASVYGALRKTQQSRKWRQVLEFLSRIDRVRYAAHYALPAVEDMLSKLGLSTDTASVDAVAVSKRLFGDQDFGLILAGENVEFAAVDLGLEPAVQHYARILVNDLTDVFRAAPILKLGLKVEQTNLADFPEMTVPSVLFWSSESFAEARELMYEAVERFIYELAAEARRLRQVICANKSRLSLLEL